MEQQQLEIVYLNQVGTEILVVFDDFVEKWQFRVINANVSSTKLTNTFLLIEVDC